MSLEKVRELMDRANSLPYGEARSMVTEEALRHAETTGDPWLAFQIRMELGGAYQFGAEPIKTFTTFSRCLAEYDADPASLGPVAGHRLLWQYKWIVYSMTQFPEVPLDRTRSAMDDMERRYKLGGHSMQAVYARRTRVAQHLGNDAAADRWFALWHTTPRDELSDCEGCDPSGKAGFLTWRGRFDEALAVAEPVLRAELNCAEQPQSILTNLMRIFVRAGRLDEARNAHLRAYRMMRSRPHELASIGEHVEFCALTGNEARGLELVQRHLGWLDRAPSPRADMWFSGAAALLLRRVEEIGHGELKITRPEREEGAEPVEVAVGELHAELVKRAEELAARFDARNGNQHQSGLVRDLMDAEPLVERLPLTEYDRPAAVVAVPETPAAEAEPVPDHTDVHDLDALLDLGEQEWQAGRVDRAVPAWRRFDELAASAGLTPVQRARRTDGAGVERFQENDFDGALAEWRRAADLYQEAGDEVSRHAALGRAGAILCGQGLQGLQGLQGGQDGQGRTEEGLALLKSSAAYLDEHAPGSKRALAARMRLAGSLLNENRPDEVLAALDGQTPEDPAASGEVLTVRAKAHLAKGDTEAAAPLLYAARAALKDAGETEQVADASLHLGKVLAHRSHQVPEGHEEMQAEALVMFDDAVSSARAGGNPWLAAAAHAERSIMLLSMERPADAVPDSVEAVAGFTALGAVPQATYARIDLTAAYHASGRHLEAAETVEEALPVLIQLDDPGAFYRARLLLAHAQRELGERQAADLFTELAEEEGDDPDAAARLLELAGEVLTGLDHDALAAERFVTAAETFATAGDPYGVVRTRRQAGLCMLWSGRPDEGLAELGLARAALADLPADALPADALPADALPADGLRADNRLAAITWETARVSYDEARILAELGRMDEALARVTEAIGGFTELDENAAAETASGLRDNIKAAMEAEQQAEQQPE